MKIISPSVSLIKETDPLLKIEKIGRVCYQSQDKITEESSVRFVEALMKRGHYSVLEHIIFKFEVESLIPLSSTKFITVTNVSDYFDHYKYHISANLRALIETDNNFFKPLVKSVYQINPVLVKNAKLAEGIDSYVPIYYVRFYNCTEPEHNYFTFNIVCDRGVTHELVRHRIASYTQESTRYVKYRDLEVIKPYFYEDIEKFELWRECMESIEDSYARLLDLGSPPQLARSVLPNSLKTQIVMTVNEKELNHIFDLRLYGKTGKPHPDMLLIMNLINKVYNEEVSQ